MPNHTEQIFPPLMLNPVFAGFPSPAEQYTESPLDLNDLLLQHPSSVFFVRSPDDFMSETGIFTGDLLIIDQSLKPSHGSMVIASINDEFLIRLYRKQGSNIYLDSANPDSVPITVTGEMQLQVHGIVTGCIHRFVGGPFRVDEDSFDLNDKLVKTPSSTFYVKSCQSGRVNNELSIYFSFIFSLLINKF